MGWGRQTPCQGEDGGGKAGSVPGPAACTQRGPGLCLPQDYRSLEAAVFPQARGRGWGWLPSLQPKP